MIQKRINLIFRLSKILFCISIMIILVACSGSESESSSSKEENSKNDLSIDLPFKYVLIDAESPESLINVLLNDDLRLVIDYKEFKDSNWQEHIQNQDTKLSIIDGKFQAYLEDTFIKYSNNSIRFKFLDISLVAINDLSGTSISLDYSTLEFLMPEGSLEYKMKLLYYENEYTIHSDEAYSFYTVDSGTRNFSSFSSLINELCENKIVFDSNSADYVGLTFSKDDTGSCNENSRQGSLVEIDGNTNTLVSEEIVGSWEIKTVGEEEILIITPSNSVKYDSSELSIFTLYDHDNNEGTEKIIFQGYLSKKESFYFFSAYNNISRDAIKETIKNAN